MVISLEMMEQRESFILSFLCHTHGGLGIVPQAKDAVPEQHDPFSLLFGLMRFDPGDFLSTVALSHIDALHQGLLPLVPRRR